MKITINIDFDGTVVTHDYPYVGKDIGAVPVLKKLIEQGHQLILFTMRDGITLENAETWFKENDIPLYGVQTNPSQHTWTSSPKSYAQLMIDDSALGCPLKYDENISGRPFVDWIKVEEELERMGVL
jgi:hypothetical protein